MAKTGRKKKGLASRQKELRRNETVRKRVFKRERLKDEKQRLKKRRKKMLHARSPYRFETEIESSPTKILLLGEGNFSFTRSLLRRAGVEGRCKLVATAFDDATSVETKYPEAKSILSALDVDKRVSVLFGVDACDVGTPGSKSWELVREASGEMVFDYIIFNFPHTGCGVKDTAKNNAIHHSFLTTVAEQSMALLRPRPKSEDGMEGLRAGELHVTLKRGAPYDDWKVPHAGRAGGLAFRTAIDFFPHLYAGYEHRRTSGIGGTGSEMERQKDEAAAMAGSGAGHTVDNALTYVFTLPGSASASTRRPAPLKRKKGMSLKGKK